MHERSGGGRRSWLTPVLPFSACARFDLRLAVAASRPVELGAVVVVADLDDPDLTVLEPGLSQMGENRGHVMGKLGQVSAPSSRPAWIAHRMQRLTANEGLAGTAVPQSAHSSESQAEPAPACPLKG